LTNATIKGDDHAQYRSQDDKDRQAAPGRNKKVIVAEAETAAVHQGITLVAKTKAAKAVTSKPRKSAADENQVTKSAKTSAQLREEIEFRAYCYWAERGYRHGNAMQDWLRAEQELQMAS